MPHAGDLLVETPRPAVQARGGFVTLDGERYYRIHGSQALPPFLMTVAGASDTWLFLSSGGGVTAGRRNARNALFPYYTDDKLVDTAASAGGICLVRVHTPGGVVLWHPFDPAVAGASSPGIRSVYRSVNGDRVVLEEERPDLGLTLRVAWRTSGRFGVVRECTLVSTGPVVVDLLDGVQNVLPPGVTPQTQDALSNLLDAYKRAEIDAETGVATLFLSSLLTDKAEPAESLSASTVWHLGLPGATVTLDPTRPVTFARSEPAAPRHQTRGVRGTYLLETTVHLEAGQPASWTTLLDTGQDAAAVVDLLDLARRPAEAAAEVAQDREAGAEALLRYLAGADALQSTGDENASVHHRANVLFNAMRGGVPATGYVLDPADVRAFVTERSTATAHRRAVELADLPADLTSRSLVEWADTTGDPDLQRLAREYLPLTFSRRHGDPSRPWNGFDIVVEDEHGAPRLDHQGNWRDIFQNWEALAWSYPELAENMVTVFLDATTIDGYNPYRISRSGIDWEVPEPDNPWSNIGYWSDHQVIYLLKLLETAQRFHPGRVEALLDRAIFTHADVPYRIKDHDQIVADPFDTIEFDRERDARSRSAVAAEGGDALLRHDADGQLVRATMGEKLLLILAAKMVNFVPGGGIWMTTQRPEWNDANNALVGRGTSLVTVAYLRRFVVCLEQLLDDDFELSAELLDLVTEVRQALSAHRAGAPTGVDAAVWRRRTMDALGAAGTAYRRAVERPTVRERARVGPDVVRPFLTEVRTHLEESLHAGRRADGLYDSYTTLHLDADRADLGALPEMLEGQVAIVSSGLLDEQETLSLLRTLRSSRLYRADQHSYQLYPDKELGSFLERNTIAPDAVRSSALVHRLTATGNRSVVVRDSRGGLHFAAGLANVGDLRAALDRLALDPGLTPLVHRDRVLLEQVYEDLFDHRRYLGRSGTFFAYEGLGSIYWHMVAKLLLAVMEVTEDAARRGAPQATVLALRSHYEDIRSGLGVCKSPQEYGAFPIDPYSHTPAGAGARQPGMTGQVKEEVLTRLGELGLRVEDGCLVIRPTLLREDEWHDRPTTFAYRSAVGTEEQADLAAGTLAFTFCQVPVVYRRSGARGVEVTFDDGTTTVYDSLQLPREVSAHVFARTGQVRRIDVRLPTRTP